jgi:hypothetical protein
VEFHFYRNTDRMAFRQLLTDDMGLDVTLGVSQISTYVNGATAADKKLSFTNFVLQNAGNNAAEPASTAKVNLKCALFTTGSTAFGGASALVTELGKVINPVRTWLSYSANAGFTEVEIAYQYDEEMFAALRYLAIADLSSNTCGHWEPTKYSCNKCGTDGAGTAIAKTDATFSAYKWEINKNGLDGVFTAPGHGVAALGGASAPCGYAHSKMIAAAAATKEMVFCKNDGGANTKKESITMYFWKDNAIDTRALGLDDSATKTVGAETPKQYNKPTSGFATLTYDVHLDAAASDTSPLAGPGKPGFGSSACGKYDQVQVVHCTSAKGSKSGTISMVMSFGSVADMETVAKAIFLLVSATPYLHTVPKATSPGALRSATFKATKYLTDKNVDYDAETHATSPTPVYALASTACDAAKTAGASDMIYCKSVKTAGGDMEVMWLGDKTGDTGAADVTARSNIRALVDAPLIGATDAQFEPYTLTSSTIKTLYTIDYDVTVSTADTAIVLASSKGALSKTALSPCKWANGITIPGAVYCKSTKTTMTLGWLYAATRKADAIKIGKLDADAASVSTVLPTAVKDQNVDSTGFIMVELAPKQIDDSTKAAKAWTAKANGKTDVPDSACHQAVDQANIGTTNTSTTKMATHTFYCDSQDDTTSKMTMGWLSHADAKGDLREIYKQTTGTETDKTLQKFAVPTASKLYTISFTLGKKTASDGETAPTIVAGDGCPHTWNAAINAVGCADTASSVTLSFLSAAHRLPSANAVAKLSAGSKVGTVIVKSAKDKGTANTMVEAVYTAKPEATATWAEAKMPGDSDSACLAAGPPANIVGCASGKGSAKGASVDMTLKYLQSATNEYVASLKTVADFQLGDKATSQQFTLKTEGTSPAPIDAVLSVALATTTKAPAAAGRALAAAAAVGSVTSTGGFATDNSWCMLLKDTPASAIFCQSTATSMTLTYLDDKLAAVDTLALTQLTTHYISLTAVATADITLTITASVEENALCANASLLAMKFASCEHEKVTVGSRQRRLSTATVVVKLGFMSAAALTAAETVFAAIDWTTVAGVSGGSITNKSGGAGGSTTAPTPGTASTPGTSPKKPSGAALRLVGVAFVAVFALV